MKDECEGLSKGENSCEMPAWAGKVLVAQPLPEDDGGKLYDGLGDNTDGAMTQKAISETIFNTTDGVIDTKKIAIGVTEAERGLQGNNSTAIGKALARGDSAISVASGGGKSVADGKNSIAIGDESLAQGMVSIAIGSNAKSSYMRSVAIGNDAKASFEEAVSIGYSTTVSNGSGTAIGRQVVATRQGAVAIGHSSMSSSDLKWNAGAKGVGAISLGKDAKALHINSIAFSGATTEHQGDVSFVTGDETNTEGYNKSRYRRITGIYDGQEAHDAVNIGQINTLIDLINGATGSTIPHFEGEPIAFSEENGDEE